MHLADDGRRLTDDRLTEETEIFAGGLDFAVTNISGTNENSEVSFHRSDWAFVIKSEAGGLAGLLLMTSLPDGEAGKHLQEEILSLLLSYTSDRGLELRIEAVFDLKERNEHLDEFLSLRAAVVRSAEYKKRKISLGLVSEINLTAGLIQSNHSGMAKLHLAEIREDVPLGFDVFLYLEANARFICYAKQARVITHTQWSALRQHQLDKIYVQMNAGTDVIRYRLENYIADTLAEFLVERRIA